MLIEELENKITNHRTEVDESGVNAKVNTTGISRRMIRRSDRLSLT